MGITVNGRPGLGINRAQSFGLSSYDMSGTAYIPSGEAEFEILCGYLSENSIVIISPSATVTTSYKLIEIHYTSLGATRRVQSSVTPSSPGSFVVGTQDLTVTGQDTYFNWKVISL